MRFIFLQLSACIFFCFFSMAAIAQPYFQAGNNPQPNGKKWSKIANLSDEFDQKNGIDRNKWFTKPVIKNKGWFWIGRPPGLFTEESINVEDGKLKITAGKLRAPVTKNGKKFTYTGGIVRSIAPCKQGWYYECKMKANKTFMSSTFWMMTEENACPKKLELDIQECVGRVTPGAADWAKRDGWDKIFHSNAIHRTNCRNRKSSRKQGVFKFGKNGIREKNSDRYFVYGFWWKSPTELWFYMDGKLKYKINNPTTTFDIPMFYNLAVETYSWNPAPPNGGMVGLSKDDRSTQYEWIRTWKLVDGNSSPSGNTNTPYVSAPFKIPGKIEAEDYDKGGEGVAYNDSDQNNEGGKYREDGVDIQADDNGGHIIGWMKKGEWLEYTVNITKSQKYTFFPHIASPEGKGKFRMLLNGKELFSSRAIPQTGSWQKYEFIQFANISLEEGTYTFRFEVLEPGFNLDKWTAWPTGNSKVGIKDELGTPFEWYPNPLQKDDLIIDFNDENTFFSVQILDMKGAVVYKTEGINNRLDVPRHQFNRSGLYFLNVNNGQTSWVRKVMVK